MDHYRFVVDTQQLSHENWSSNGLGVGRTTSLDILYNYRLKLNGFKTSVGIHKQALTDVLLDTLNVHDHVEVSCVH